MTLPQKGLLLVVVPLIIQLGVLGYLTYLQLEEEQITVKAAHASEVDSAINQLVKNFLDNTTAMEWEPGNGKNRAGSNNSDNRDDSNNSKRRADSSNSKNRDDSNNKQTEDTEYLTFKSEISQTLARLKELLKNEPQKKETVEEIERTAINATNILEAHKANSRTSLGDDTPKLQKRKFRACKDRLNELLSQQLIPLCSEEKRVVAISPELQAENRNRVRAVLLATVLVDILFAIVVAVYYNRDIVKRLTTIFDNNLRLASGLPLLPPVAGSDEITKLDNVFHEMAAALEQAAQKERLVVENARDLICSLDAKGAFLTVSPASAILLGYSPDELIGSKISNLIHSSDRDAAQNNLKLMMDGEQLAPFETRLVRKDGAIVDGLWSASWSPTEESLFCVVHDNTERKRAERLRQEIVQMVSHDLRTPLTSIRGILELLENDAFGNLNDRGKKMVGLANQSSLRMLSLIRDLLEIEKMEAGMLELNRMRVPINSLIEQSIATVQPIAVERKVNLVGDSNPSEIFVDGDRIIQVLVNLIGNAIKFSPPNSTVRVQVKTDNQSTEFSVIDEGRGIPDSSLSTIFERFKQLQESDSKKDGGSGLGLAICKALVELHGGDISVSSAIGKGSNFSFRIPN